MKHLHQLTKTEFQILHLLSQGVPYRDISTTLSIGRSSLHVHCARIRQKTGITSTRDKAQCHAAYTNRKQHQGQETAPLQVSTATLANSIPAGPAPTTKQLRALSLRSRGFTYEQIAQAMKITPQTAMNTVSQGCQRAGITGARKDRPRRIREYLRNPGAVPARELTVDDL